MRKRVDKNLYKALKAIAEGYPVSAKFDQFVVVSNPEYQEDNGSDPNLVINAG